MRAVRLSAPRHHRQLQVAVRAQQMVAVVLVGVVDLGDGEDLVAVGVGQGHLGAGQERQVLGHRDLHVGLVLVEVVAQGRRDLERLRALARLGVTAGGQAEHAGHGDAGGVNAGAHEASDKMAGAM
jgi:hypothetical protein